MILHTVLLIWLVALVAGIIVERRNKYRRLKSVGTVRYITHTQTYMNGA